MARYTTAGLIAKIRAEAAAWGQDPEIAVEQLRRESINFRPSVIYGPQTSPKGALGLAQFIPATWARFGSGDPFNPDDAIPAYFRYMDFLIGKFGGRYDLALAGYNSGENRSEYARAAREGRAINWAVLPAGVQSETRPYVAEILRRTGREHLIPTKPPAKAGSGAPSQKKRSA